jgi:DNA modification methylase
MKQDIFGNIIEENELLRDKFIEPPFSVLDTKSGSWQNRKRMWGRLGIKSEVGRDVKVINNSFANGKYGRTAEKDSMCETSIFDPALTEVLYHWFCPIGGSILDPFAGGSVRGIVANYMGFNYTGIDIRPEQIESNYEQARVIVPGNEPNWLCGDSNVVLDDLLLEQYDMILSCPPYADLEVYSKLPGDISNMSYPDFLNFYTSIIKKSCQLLKPGGYAAWVIGEVRGKDGGYYGFVPDTIKAFRQAGMHFYNEAILLNAIGTAMLRVGNTFKSGKLVKVHQNVLIFKK